MSQCTYSEPMGNGVTYVVCAHDAVCLGRCTEHAQPAALEALAAMEDVYEFLATGDHEQGYYNPRTGVPPKIQLRRAIAGMKGIT